MKLQNTTSLITGGSSGLGLAVAKSLLKKGSIVHIVASTQTSLDEAKKAVKIPNSQMHRVDVTQHHEVKKLIEQIGKVDVLVNAAGILIDGSLEESTYEAISHGIDVNVKGLMYVTKAVLPDMLRRDKGVIVNVSSTSGLHAKEHHSIYCASKSAVHMFTASLELDLASTHIRVLGFYPGGMNTPFFARAGVHKPLKDFMNPQDVAKVMVFMIEQDHQMALSQVVVSRHV